MENSNILTRKSETVVKYAIKSYTDHVFAISVLLYRPRWTINYDITLELGAEAKSHESRLSSLQSTISLEIV